MNSIEQIAEANARLNKAMQALNRFDYGCFTEMEVLFRIETISNMILIVQSDMQEMRKEWEEAAQQERTADGWWVCVNCGHRNEEPDRACNQCFATRR